MSKPILCVDFDGVIHSYTSKWVDATTIPDPPVEGAFAFLEEAVKHFDVHIFSSRSNHNGGIAAMLRWMYKWTDTIVPPETIHDFKETWINDLTWATSKPPAFVTIDDRALTFTGNWPTIDALKAFKPWNK